MPRFEGPALLAGSDPVTGFQCGVDSLDVWLVRHSRAASAGGSARTYVLTDGEQNGRVVGFHALTVASIQHADAIERARKGMPKNEIPAVLVARLAVDVSVQGRGLGGWLLADAMKRSISVAEELGIRIILVHATNDSARDFYLRFGFEISPTNPMNVQMLVKDARESLDKSAEIEAGG